MTARGIRNNNPSNIEDGVFARSCQGYAGPEEPQRRFATFETMAYGIAANIKLLRIYHDAHRLNTVRGIINRWAPPVENETSAYVRHVCEQMHVLPDDELPDDATTYERLARAIIVHESGPDAAQISSSDYALAVRIIYPGQPVAVPAGEIQPPTSTEAAPATSTQKEPPMAEDYDPTAPSAGATAPSAGTIAQAAAPLLGMINPLLGVAAAALPQIAQIFADKSQSVSDRNIKTGAVVLNTIQSAVGASTQAQAVAKIVDDPQARQVALDALRPLIEVVEASGGVREAREFALKVDDRPFYERALFWVSAVFLVAPFMLLADVFYVHPGNYDGNLKVQIVTALLAIFSMVGAVWFGRTIASKSKDQTIQQLSSK